MPRAVGNRKRTFRQTIDHAPSLTNIQKNGISNELISPSNSYKPANNNETSNSSNMAFVLQWNGNEKGTHIYSNSISYSEYENGYFIGDIEELEKAREGGKEIAIVNAIGDGTSCNMLNVLPVENAVSENHAHNGKDRGITTVRKAENMMVSTKTK